MARKVFFSFYYQDDIFQVNQIRNSWRFRSNGSTQPFVDKAEFESIKRTGDNAVRNWINKQMLGCGVLAVLIGPNTHSRKWVRYEVQKAAQERMGIVGIHLGGMKKPYGLETKSFGITPSPLFRSLPIYTSVSEYNWVRDVGYMNMERWINSAAAKVGR